METEKSNKLIHSKILGKTILSLILVCTLLVLKTNAQTSIVIGAGALNGISSNSNSGDCGPIFRSGATSTFIYSRHHYLYTQSELAASGIFAGMRITKLSWNKVNAEAFNSAAAFEIWIKNSSLTTVQAPTQTWANLISGSTQFYNSPTTLVSTIGYVDFNGINPFIYNGGALEISVSYDHSAGSSPWSTLGVSWAKDNTSGTTLSYCGNVASTNLSNARTVRPQLKFTFATSFAPNNTGVSELVAPNNFCSGFQNVKVRINNYGNNKINNVTIQWKIDGIMQTPVLWNSTLDTVDGLSPEPSDTVVTLGSVLFGAAPRTLIAWTELPNSQTDTTNSNDTLYKTLKSFLSGNYTIGGTSPDYATFTAAVNDLNNLGICGPVNFEVRSGTYNERITINQVIGVSATNTITFKGFSKTATILTYAATGTADLATVLLNGSDYITFRDMSIGGSNVTYGVGVLLTGDADYNILRNLKIQMNITSTASTTAGVAISGATTTAITAGNNGDFNTFDSLDINGAYYGISIYGTSNTVYNLGHKITNCIFTNVYYYAIIDYYQRGILIQKNRINPLRNSTCYGIYNYYSSNYVIDGNYIQSPHSGLYNAFSNINNFIANFETTISNNMIAAGSGYGIYFTQVQYVRMIHNTVLVTGSNSVTLSLASGTHYDLRNNIFVSTYTGTNLYGLLSLANGVTFDSLDYNNYYAAGATFITGSNTYASLAAWKLASPTYNINSLSVDPLFISNTNLHLQLTSPPMFGINLGFLKDIDDQIRLLPPTMGSADRAQIRNNAGITKLVNPIGFCAGNHNIKVNLINHGKNIINSLTINWELDGIAQSPVFWSYPIDTFGGTGKNDTTISLGTVSFAANINRTVKVWTSMPNSFPDLFNDDDTIFANLKTSLSGVYTVGASGNYSSLTAAMADMQQGICGPVILELQNNYSSAGETFPIVINPVGLSATNNLIIRPALGVSAFNISSANSVATIDLNEAKYVTIDGRPGGIGSKVLTIINTSATGAAIRFINDARFNKLSNLTITANNTSTTSGVILFSNTTKTFGNSNNLIDSCFINGNSASVNCILSIGSSTPADNKSNTITNCNIYDFFSNVASTDISGIALLAGNSLWNIGIVGNGNKFYQTADRTPTSTPALTNAIDYKAIYINDKSVNGCSITGNIIGGNIPGIPGSTFIIGSTVTNLGHSFRAIDNFSSGDSIANSIQGNTIANITLYSTIDNSFIGIQGSFGLVNIIGNTIGLTTGTGSIIINHMSTTTGANSYGIRYESANGLIQNNTVGAISAEVQVSGGAMQLAGIYITGSFTSPLIISNNLIGSYNTSHSIQSTAASIGAINVIGLCANQTIDAPIIFSNNNVVNLSSLCNVSSTTNGVKGIYIMGTSAVGTTITGNIVSKLYSVSANTGTNQNAAVAGITSFTTGTGTQIISNNVVRYLMSNITSITAVNINGIHYGSTTTATGNKVSNNLVYSFTNALSNSNAIQNGILISGGTTRVAVANNMVSLGYDTNGVSFTGATPINGIAKTGGIASIYYNSIKIGGTGVGNNGANTFAYTCNTNAVDTLMNNIFLNTRTNAITGGIHYAIGLTSATNLLSNYNLYYNSFAPLGLFSSVNQSNLAAWRIATLQDVNSASANINFSNITDLHLSGSSIGNTILIGKPIVGLTTDFDLQTRNALYPYMGADENTSNPLPVKLVYVKATIVNKDVQVLWSTASELNSSHFIVEASIDGKNFQEIGKITAKGNSSVTNNYSFMHLNANNSMNNAPIIYYRLIAFDLDGSFEKSTIVQANFEGKNLENITVFPNPFTQNVFVNIEAKEEGSAVVEIIDIVGKVITVSNQPVNIGNNQLEIKLPNALRAGVYFLNICKDGQQSIHKIIKQ